MHNEWQSEAKMKPSSSMSFLPSTFISSDAGNFISPDVRKKAVVWPIKVAFADGTTWEDDGSHSCSMSSESDDHK
jgi:hypothetical protein